MNSKIPSYAFPHDGNSVYLRFANEHFTQLDEFSSLKDLREDYASSLRSYSARRGTNASGREPITLDFELLSDEILEEDAKAFRQIAHMAKRELEPQQMLREINYRPFTLTFTIDLLEEEIDNESLLFDFMREGVWFEVLSKEPSTHSDNYGRVAGELRYSGVIPDSDEDELTEVIDLYFIASKQKPDVSIYAITTPPNRFPSGATPQNALDKHVPDFCPSFIDVYSVGMANCLAIHGLSATSTDDVLMFDVGCKNASLNRKNHRAFCNEVGSLNPSIIILSHWDSDHVNGWKKIGRQLKSSNGATYPQILTRPWIASDYRATPSNLPGVNALRLAKTLDSLQVLCLVDDSSNHPIARSFSSKSCLRIWQGQRQDIDSNIELNNQRCLILEIIHFERGIFILAADAPYHSFPNTLQTRLPLTRGMVAPHHGSEMCPCPATNTFLTDRRRFAIWCTKLDYDQFRQMEKTGIDNKESHPVKTSGQHIKTMYDHEFRNFPTGNAALKIRIDLNGPSVELYNTHNRCRRRYHFSPSRWLASS